MSHGHGGIETRGKEKRLTRYRRNRISPPSKRLFVIPRTLRARTSHRFDHRRLEGFYQGEPYAEKLV